jgi:hypothetical protein
VKNRPKGGFSCASADCAAAATAAAAQSALAWYDYSIRRMRLPTILLFITSLVLAVSHALALQFSLYWQYVWLDVPMHLLGGIIVGLALVVARDMRVPLVPSELRLYHAIALAFLIGIIWELFELWGGLAMARNYAFDTTLDLVMDVFGGLSGYYVGVRARQLD